MQTITNKTLFYGDNLEVLRNKITPESVDLCYIDPPFNSKRNYFQIYNNIGSEDKAQAQAFIDTWTWDTRAMEGYEEIITNHQGRFTKQTIELIKGLKNVLAQGSLLAYLVSMTLRITEIHRVLKQTGSFYLHCDPTCSHYLKLVLDSIFCIYGGDFRNEIIWSYRRWPAKQKNFQKMHDIIFRYAKTDMVIWNQLYENLSPTTLKADKGKKILNVFDPVTGKRIRGEKTGEPSPGAPMRDVWDIGIISPTAKERLGYPTQKPEALLERIIKASSNEGDLILDAYCGCGTSIAVAERLKRNWIGIDITYQSISLVLRRLEDTFGNALLQDIKLDGIPQDIESAIALANRKDDRLRKEFEKWAVLTYSNNRAVINTKKGADKGIDGTAYFALPHENTGRIVFQVKSGKVNRSTIATLRGDMEREQAAMGILITLEEPSKPMNEEAKTAGIFRHELMNRNYDRIQIITVKEIVEEYKRLEMPLSFEVVRKAEAKNRAQQMELTS